MDEIKLLSGGKSYRGWKSTKVVRGIEAVSGSFDLGVSDRSSSQDDVWPIRKEDECSVLINDTTLLTGYVDRRGVSFSAEDHSLSVSGKDKTANLVECSAILPKWEFFNIELLNFVSQVCKPFGITARLQIPAGQPALKRVTRLSIDPGDSAFEAIERACRMAGVLAMADGLGGLLLTRPGTERATTALIEGKNILAASLESDATEQFRTYLVLGQHHGSDSFSGTSAAHISATAEDASVRRSERKLLIRPEGDVNTDTAKRRAEWEAIVRAARGDSVAVTVQGWTQGDGSVWPVNALVNVESPRMEISGDMLITQATYSMDDGGTVTRLALRRPDAFIPQPVIRKSVAFSGLAGGV